MVRSTHRLRRVLVFACGTAALAGVPIAQSPQAPAPAAGAAAATPLDRLGALAARLDDATEPSLTAAECGQLLRLHHEVFAGPTPPLPRAALPLHRAAERAAAQLGQPELVLNYRWERAKALQRIGALEEARALLEEGLAEHAAKAPNVAPWLYLELAQVKRLQRSFEGILDDLLQAKAALRAGSLPYHDQLAVALEGEWVELASQLGTLDQVAVHFERERELSRPFLEQDDPAFDGMRLQVRRHELVVLLAQERGAEAAAIAGESLEDRRLLAASADAEASFRCYRGFARLAAGRDDRELAAAGFEDLRAAAADAHLQWPERLAALGRLIYEGAEAGDFAAASADFEAMQSLVEQVGARAGAAEDSALARDLLVAEAHLLRRSGADAARLRALRAELEHSLSSAFDSLRRLPAVEGGLGLFVYARSRDALAELVALIVAEGGDGAPSAGLRWILEAQRLGSLARERDLAAPSLDEIRREVLHRGEGLLVYLPAQVGSHLFAVDADGIAHFELGSSRTLKDAVQTLRRAVSVRPADAADGTVDPAARRRAAAAAARAGAWLFPEALAARLEAWRAVAITGLDLLGYVPIACSAPYGGDYLGSTHELRSLPSLPFALHAARRPRAAVAAVDLVVLAAPRASERARELGAAAAELPFGPADAERFTAAYGEGRARALAGAEATRAGLLAISAADARCLQIVAHGAYLASELRPAALALTAADADDGLFRCADAERMKSPEIVVLATCGAETGPARNGDDGVQHFGGAFLRAGARTVVLSPAELDFRATMELLVEFQIQLAAGAAPAAALRRARSALAREPRFAHPYYFGLLDVIGG